MIEKSNKANKVVRQSVSLRFSALNQKCELKNKSVPTSARSKTRWLKGVPRGYQTVFFA